MRSWFIFRTVVDRAAANVEPEKELMEARTGQVSASPLAWSAAKHGHVVLPREPERLAWPRAVLLIGLLSIVLWLLVGATLLLLIG